VSPSSTFPRAPAAQLARVGAGGRRGHPRLRHPGPEGPEQTAVELGLPRRQLFLRPHLHVLGPLANLKVRQALNFATNRVAINNALLYGKGQPAWSIFPTSSSYYDKALTTSTLQPDKGQGLLAQAGYPHGFSTSIMPCPNPRMISWPRCSNRSGADRRHALDRPDVELRHRLLHPQEGADGTQPEGLPGIQKITTQYIPGDVGDRAATAAPPSMPSTSSSGSPPSSPKLKSIWTKIQLFIIHNALTVYIVYAPEVTGAQKDVTGVQNIPYVGGVLNYWGVSVPG